MGFPGFVMLGIISICLQLLLSKKVSLDDLEEPPKYEEFALKNKKADLKRFLPMIVFGFLIYFLFLSVLPGHEKIYDIAYASNEFQCTAGLACAYGGDCDNPYIGNSGTCTECSDTGAWLGVDGNWWNQDWQYRMKLTFDNSGQSGGLDYFPVLVKLTNANFNYGGAQGDGDDLRFVDADDLTPLSYEIEDWNSGSTSYIWVAVPNIPASSNSDYIWLYYGNGGASNGEDVANVWDSNYVGVWHLSETGTGTRYDATTYNNDGTPNGYDGDEATTGKVDGADDFDGNNDYIRVTDSASLSFAAGADFTFSTWVRTGVCQSSGSKFVEKKQLGSESIQLECDANRPSFGVRDSNGNSANPIGSTSMTDNNWHYITGLKSGNNVYVFLDGTQEDSASTTYTGNWLDGDVRIGTSIDLGARFTDGILDEVRISDIDRSTSWIKASYLTMDQQSFPSYGSEESLPTDFSKNCCGDDSGEDFENPGAGNSCCLEATAIIDGGVDITNNFLCSDGQVLSCNSPGTYTFDDDYVTCGGPFEGKTCTASGWSTTATGCDCTSDDKCGGPDVCIDTDNTCGGSAVCTTPGSANDGYCCSSDATVWTNAGIVTRTSGGSWGCDYVEASFDTGDYYSACDQSTGSSEPCESGGLGGGFTQDGVCAGGTGGTGVIAVDSVSTGTTTGSSINIPHKTSGSDRLMLVGVSILNTNDFPPVANLKVNSITYNGDSLTYVGSEDQTDDSRMEIWSRIAPDIGTYNVVVTFGAAIPGGATVGVMTFTGVDQTTPLSSFYSENEDSKGTTEEVVVPSAVDELVFDTIACETCVGWTEGPGQTLRWNENANRVYGAGSTEPGALSVTMSWTPDSPDHWALGAVSIKPAPGGAPICDIDEVCINSGIYYDGCSNPNCQDGDQCDMDVNPGYVQDGICQGGVCTSICGNTGEDDWFVPSQDCDQCNLDHDHDGDQPGDWSSYPGKADQCDSDCPYVLTTVQLTNYQSTEALCSDNIDNDCDGDGILNNMDYDGNSNDNGYDAWEHGDNNCPVAVNSITSPPQVCPGQVFVVRCAPTPLPSVDPVTSIKAQIDGESSCVFTSWDIPAEEAVFSCTAPLAENTYTVNCFVDTFISYQTGPNRTSSLIVDLAGCCNGYGDSVSCEADSNCNWCLECGSGPVINKFSGQNDTCVPDTDGDNNCYELYYCEATIPLIWQPPVACGVAVCDFDNEPCAGTCPGPCPGPSCLYNLYGCQADCTCLPTSSEDPDSNIVYCDPGCSLDWTGNPGQLACCGDDLGEASPYQPSESNCFDTNDNDCDGFCDIINDACWPGSQADSDCVALLSLGYIHIKNLGQTGFEQINQEYTSTRTVFLELNYTANPESCAYANYDDPYQEPPFDYIGWTSWEPCVVSRIWQLTENPGLKTVYYKVNYTSTYTLLNDSIYYNFTGAGLDTTAPNPPIIVDGDYTNNNTVITISWYNASDPESEILGIPLQYDYLLYLPDGTILDAYTTTETTKTTTGLNLPHLSVVYANVSVINSAGLKSNATSDGLIVDLEKPTIDLDGSYRNVTNSLYYNLPVAADWIYTYLTNFSWLGADAVTVTVAAYSYILTQDSGENPDNVPEGTIGSFDTETSKSYTASSGEYYFKVRAKDWAGNWGDPASIEFWIDNTAPSESEILTETRTNGEITYTWSQSIDPESDLKLYMINLTNSTGHTVDSAIITDLGNRIHTFNNVPSGVYNATVGALNNVDIWKWSGEEETKIDFTPPVIVATPNRTVIVSSPILKAWTDEPATCYYNLSNNDIEFSYSNTTYHETKIYNLANAPYTYKITCIDKAGNSDFVEIDFTVNTTMSHTDIYGPASLNTYEDLITAFTIDVQDLGVDIAGIVGERYKLTLDGKDHEVVVFDMGTGFYNVSFTAPDPGSYNLLLEIDGSTSIPFTLTVQDLFLTSSYTEAGMSPDKTDHITYYTSGDWRSGAATDSDNPIINSIASILNISNIKLENNLFLFNTKAKTSMNSRERLLKDQSFMKNVNPSFGLQIDNAYIINYILRYDNFVIQSEMGNKLGLGRYNSLVRNTISDAGERRIIFTGSQ